MQRITNPERSDHSVISRTFPPRLGIGVKANLGSLGVAPGFGNRVVKPECRDSGAIYSMQVPLKARSNRNQEGASMANGIKTCKFELTAPTDPSVDTISCHLLEIPQDLFQRTLAYVNMRK